MKKKQPRNTCVFCHIERKLSEEHILPEWLINNNVIPRNQEFFFEHDFSFDNLGSIPSDSEKRRRQGYLGNKRRRVVCVECNGGWMSKLQKDNKEVLTALIRGDQVDLDKFSTARLYQWIVMTAFVVSFASANRVLTREHANCFYKSGHILPGPIIYIGRYEGPHKIRRNNVCGYYGAITPGVKNMQNIQFVSITLGKLFIQLAFSTRPEVQPYVSKRFEPFLYLLFPPLYGPKNNFYKHLPIDHFTAKLIQERLHIEPQVGVMQDIVIQNKYDDFRAKGD